MQIVNAFLHFSIAAAATAFYSRLKRFRFGWKQKKTFFSKFFQKLESDFVERWNGFWINKKSFKRYQLIFGASLIFFKKNGPIPASFRLFSSFPPDSVLGTRTRGGKMAYYGGTPLAGFVSQSFLMDHSPASSLHFRLFNSK